MTRRLALFALGAWSLAVAAVRAAEHAPNAPCQHCDRRPEDNALEHGILGPNLEWGA